MTNTSAKLLKKNNSYNCTWLHIKDLINQRHTHLPLYKNSLHKTCMSLLQLYYGGFFFLFLHCIQPTKSSCKLQQYRYTLVWCWDAFSRSQHKVCTTQHEWGSNSHQNRMYKNPFFKNMLVMLHILVPTQTTLKLNSLVTRQVGVMTTLIAEFYLWEQFFNV